MILFEVSFEDLGMNVGFIALLASYRASTKLKMHTTGLQACLIDYICGKSGCFCSISLESDSLFSQDLRTCLRVFSTQKSACTSSFFFLCSVLNETWRWRMWSELIAEQYLRVHTTKKKKAHWSLNQPSISRHSSKYVYNSYTWTVQDILSSRAAFKEGILNIGKTVCCFLFIPQHF